MFVVFENQTAQSSGYDEEVESEMIGKVLETDNGENSV